ncbi:hypothetical protein GCM10010218_61780 [Streptomyces mashuensis]|uniref:Integral membrane protein n=1 Tax=Streptomyces mashuensis TaxID=33904 RepID=A0A919BA77_9ACTN|nr:streptophobe family protein [Streptomyces mashuensis]GHF72139.1 hypothetical protein GCM10010218_61780 [Streptomyces mashuensis]
MTPGPATGSGPGGAPDLLLTAVAAVSWAFLAMAAVAAAGLHLLGADAAGSLGPMTAAVVVLAVGGSVTPSGSVEAFGLTGAGAHTTIDLVPLGVSLVGALVLGTVLARSLRRAGAVVGAGALVARVAAVAVVFLAVLGGLAWAGSSVITFDGKGLGSVVPGSGGKSPGLDLPGLGDIGDIGGGLPGRLADLAGAKAAVGFSVRTGASLLGGLVWVLVVALVTLLAARRAPLPRAWAAGHRTVRPAASALCAVLVLAVVAGLSAAVGAATGDDRPGRVLGAALLGAPNGVWLGVPLGLFVPWSGSASGSLLQVLPHPLDELLRAGTARTVTPGTLADLSPAVWLLPLGCGLLMLTAGVLTAARTPVGRARAGAFALRCGLSLGAVTAVALPLLVLATRVEVGASLSVLGIDAVGAGLSLEGSVPLALLLGAAWGLAAGLLGGLLAYATGSAGRRAAPYAREGTGPGGGGGAGQAYGAGFTGGPYVPPGGGRPEANPYLRPPGPGTYDAPTETWRGPAPPLPRRQPPQGRQDPSRPRYGHPPPPPPDGPPPPPRGRR